MRTAPADVLTVSDLEQLRLLADPTRLRMIEVFCAGECTTKQVAERLDEKPTKLYHHVEALERVGLIKLARTRQNRGTLEKYYRAVARAFRVDARVFEGRIPKAAVREEVESVAMRLLESTAAELRQRMAAAGDGARGVRPEEALMSMLEVRTDEAGIRRLRARIGRLIASLGTPRRAARRGRIPSDRRYRLTIAFFPLDCA